MRLITDHGDTVKGDSAREIAEVLNRGNIVPAENLDEFMADVAERIMIQTGRVVRSGNAEDFIADLIEQGYLRREG